VQFNLTVRKVFSYRAFAQTDLCLQELPGMQQFLHNVV